MSLLDALKSRYWRWRRERPISYERRANETVVLCCGDSMTDSAYPMVLQGLCAAEGLEVAVLNAGVSGHSSAEYLAFVRARDLFASTRPDAVLLQLGTNDVRCDYHANTAEDFGRNLRAIAEAALAVRTPTGAQPVLILGTVPPLLSVTRQFTEASARRICAEINPVIAALAAELGAGMVDNHALLAERPELLAGNHPTEAGYDALAQSWFGALKEHLSCAS